MRESPHAFPLWRRPTPGRMLLIAGIAGEAMMLTVRKPPRLGSAIGRRHA